MSRKSLYGFGFFLALCFLSMVSTAHGQETIQAEIFNAKLRRGTELYQNQKYEAAIAQFQEAYSLKSDPTILYNLGQAHRKLGRETEAINYYEFFLRTATNVESDLRKKVDVYIKELRDRIIEKERTKLAAARAGYVSDVRAPRPKWRLALGSVTLAAGVASVIYGARAISANGKCGFPPAFPGGECDQVYTTLALGAPMTAFGALLVVGGITMIAIPGTRVEQKIDTPAKEPTLLSISISSVGSGPGAVLSGQY